MNTQKLNSFPRRSASAECIYHGLVHAPFIYLLEELVIVAIVNMHADKHGAWSIKCLLEHRGNLIRRLDHEASGTEGLRILHWIHRSEFDARGSSIFLFFLNGDHVIGSINPDHVHEIRLEPYRGFEF